MYTHQPEVLDVLGAGLLIRVDVLVVVPAQHLLVELRPSRTSSSVGQRDATHPGAGTSSMLTRLLPSFPFPPAVSFCLLAADCTAADKGLLGRL